MKQEQDQFISFNVQEGIAALVLDRPPLNVLNISMLQQLETALRMLAENEDVRALILQAKGKMFSAGVDVADHTAEKVGEMIPLFDRVCQATADFPVPTLAAVHGHALGGGCELVLCCDLMVLAESAKMGQPEIQLATIAPVAALRLPWLIGYRAVADMMFTGRSLTAQEALQIGLVNAVVPAEQVNAWVQEKATQIAGLSRSAVILLKRAMALGYQAWTDALPKMEHLYLEGLMNTADAHEGLAAFVEKRKPVWQHK